MVYFFFFISLFDPIPGNGLPLQGFAITLTRHTTLGVTPLDDWSARRRELFLITHKNHKRQTSFPRWNSNPQFQQASGFRPPP